MVRNVSVLCVAYGSAMLVEGGKDEAESESRYVGPVFKFI
jgi:hypothetical protein